MTRVLQLSSRANRSRHGFTIVETVMASAMISIFVLGSMAALTQMNRYAGVARLRTMALAVAQERIDEILTTSWMVTAARPAVLTAGTRTESSLPLGTDSLNDQVGLKSNFTSLGVPVNATRTTQITDLTTRQFRAVVTVSFTYRSRAYQVALTTLRTTDNF